MAKKKSKEKYYQDSNSMAIIGLLFAIVLVYVEQYLDFSYIFALSLEDNTLISISYLLLGFSSLVFWTMSLVFIMAIRFDIFFNYEDSLSASKDRKFKLFKAQNYSYLAIFSLFLCFMITLKLRPSNYLFLKEQLISLL